MGPCASPTPFRNRDLLWALKGGGGGSFGVVTRLTLRTHTLPAYFRCGALTTITAASDAAYVALVGQVLSFYRERLLNPTGERCSRFGRGRQISVNMVFQGLTGAQAERTWAPLFAWVRARPADYTLATPVVLPVRAGLLECGCGRGNPRLIVRDDRPGAPEGYFYWAGRRRPGGAGAARLGHSGCRSGCLPGDAGRALVDALTRASQIWPVALHCNKGLAGAPANVLDWTRNTSMNPAVLDSFALAIAGANEPPAYPGIAGHEPDVAQGRRDARVVAAAMAPLNALAERPASYLSETDYFQDDWQASFWGDHYTRLTQVKDHYDPGGLFSVHHGVGTET